MAKEAVLKESPAELEQYYREMLFIRHFEEKCNFSYRQGKSGGYLHVYIGMEALAIGWMHSIRKGEDYVITAYRDHGHALARGMDPGACMAEMFGKATGCAGSAIVTSASNTSTIRPTALTVSCRFDSMEPNSLTG